MENLVNIGTIVGTHHLTGSVKINSMFEGIDVIVGERVLLEKDSRRKVLLVKSVKRINEKKAIINFEGINNIDLAKELNGLQIKIRRDLLPEKTEDDFYLKDLLGVEVFEKGEKIGEVIDIMETAAHDILVIQDIKNHKEILVPQIDVFVKKIDFDNNKMDVELIEGMREETDEN
jgi:16S rRNA processing protein rimM